MAKISSPNKEYVGESAGVNFLAGVGYTDDPIRIEWFRNNGYSVDEPAPDPVSQPQLDAADTNKNPLVPDTGIDPRVPQMATSDAPVKLNENPPTSTTPITGVQVELLLAAANRERDEAVKALDAQRSSSANDAKAIEAANKKINALEKQVDSLKKQLANPKKAVESPSEPVVAGVDNQQTETPPNEARE